MTKKYKGFTIETSMCYVTMVYDANGNQVGEASYDYSKEGRDFVIKSIKNQIDAGEINNEDQME